MPWFFRLQSWSQLPAPAGLLAQEGGKVIRRPPRLPNLNAFAQRFVRPTKDGCVDRVIFSADHRMTGLCASVLYRCPQSPGSWQ
jgi:hypothetical protein